MNPWRAPFLAERLLPWASSVWRRILCRWMPRAAGRLCVGLLAGCVPAVGLAARAEQPRTAERAVVADASAPTRFTPADLKLSREGILKAEALASFAQGLIAEDDGDNDAAFEAYRRSLAAEPNNIDLAVKVAFELARRGEVAEGIALLKDVAKASPRDPLPPLCLAQIYAQFLKKPALAIRQATTALELDPSAIGPYLMLIELYRQGGQPKRADAILEKALKSDSKEGEFWSQLAELCMGRDIDKEGKVAPDKLKRLNNLFQKALACDPDNPETIVKAADFYYNTRQFDPAVPLYRKAIAAEEEPASEEALALRDKLVRALMEGGQRGQALEILRQMAADAPHRLATLALLGDVQLLEGRLEEALAAYREVLQIEPSIVAASIRVADLEMRLGQGEKAVATLREGRKRILSEPLITYSLAVTLAQMLQYPEALALFEEAVHEATVSKPQLLNAAFYFAYGMAAEQSGDLERAAPLIQKSIALDPDNAAAQCNYLGYMWVEHGVHLQEAGELIRRALAREPKNGAYLDSLGWYYYMAGDYPQAAATLAKAVAALPEPDPVVLEHLGDAHAATGDKAKALEAWKKALALDAADKELAAKIAKAEGDSKAGK